MKIEVAFTQCNFSLQEELELTRELGRNTRRSELSRSPRWEGNDVGAFMCTNFVHNGCVGGHNVFFFLIFHILVLKLLVYT